jgi:hypothetical protein
VSITPITTPLPGEQVVQLSPADANEAAVTWLRRPNLFAGRALTAPTLDARSRWAAGHVVVRGQAFTPGVVRGLELGFRVTPPAETGARAQVVLQISAGRGLATSGEDVWLARAIELDFFGLPVIAPPDVFEGGGGTGGDEEGALRARAIGPSLGEVLAANPGALPRAGVIVLQPVSVDSAAVDPLDPCDRCGCAEGNVSYEDWRIVDAVRLAWYAWPDEWRALPVAGPRFRNAVAHTIFAAERELGPDAMLPWEEFGVPIALIGVDADYVPAFSDRAAVARTGGRAQVSRLQLGTRGAALALDPRPRLAALWQAQIEQLAGQVADLGDPAPAADVLAQSFGRLPPVGLLPTNVFDLTTHSSAFFPGGFDLDAVPVPVEQLDLAVRESAPLAPIDFSLRERVRVLVPVSQASWEPRLLLTEAIDPLFQQTLDGYLLARARALGARQGLRVTRATLLRAIDATPTAVPDIADDPEALEVESFAPWGPPPPGGGHAAALAAGLHQHFFASATATITPAAGESLYAWVYLDPDNPPQTLMLQWHSGNWEHRAYWGANTIPWGTDGTESRRRMGDLPPLGRWLRVEVPAASVGLAGQAINGMAFTLFDGRAAYGPSGVLVAAGESGWFAGLLPAGAQQHGDYPWRFLTPNGLWSPFEPGFGLVLRATGAAGPAFPGVSSAVISLLAEPAMQALSAHERGQLDARGLRGFIAYLTSRTDRVDDAIDYGFVKIQTDIYRIRQLVLNTTAATRLAVSPTLAGIAQAETAVASQAQISTFFDALRGSGSTGAGGTTPPPAGGGGGTGGGTISLGATAFRATALNTTALRNVTVSTTAGAGTRSGSELAAGSGFAVLDSGLSRGFSLAGAQAANLQFSTEVAAVLPTYTATDIANASPLVGNATLRGLTIAERLAQPRAQEARDYSSASRREAVQSLLTLVDTLRAEDAVPPADEGPVSGLFADLDVFGIRDDPFLAGLPAPERASRRRPFAHFIGADRATLLTQLVQPPPRTTDPDESLHFSDATDTSDTTVALLRQIEGRVRQFRDVIAACQRALVTIQGDYASAGRSEVAWSEKLAEARHDVAVTRALIVEEQARLDAINARRAAVLAAEVRFLAYIRPRDADNLRTPPARVLDPGLIEPPVPACLREHPDIPDELTEMLAVVREAPAAWFGQGERWFDGLGKVSVLVKAVQTTQLRTQLAAATAPALKLNAVGLAGAIANITARQSQTVRLARSAALQVDPVRLAALNWQGAFQQAVQVVSLGDLISGEHGSAAASKRAADFYDRFAAICACLHAEFSAVPPAIRLVWATLLSEFDKASNLRNLASLPRWSELGFVDRRQMQTYADWLFGQASATEARAQALVNDVVRMCLLLASHAPVDRIIAGRLPRPVTARPGIRIPLVALDASRLRLGMHAVVYRANQIVARAVVEDVGGAEVGARVLSTSAASVELDETVRVQFAPAAAVSFAATAIRVVA